MRRSLTELACAVLLVGACAAAPAGPLEPLEQEQLTGDEAANSADARATAIAFVHAYGAADPSGLVVMTALAGSPVMQGWVHWQAVQYSEFPGTAEGTVDLREVSVAEPVDDIPGTSTLLRDVALDAVVNVDYTPHEGDPFSNTRSIDAVRVARNEGEPWAVVDLVRDGVPISTVFQPVGAEVPADGLSVELDSFIADPASGSWQFDMVARSSHPDVLTLEPAQAVLVDTDGTEIAAATHVSGAIASLEPGAPAEGLVRFDALDDTSGVTLRLTFQGELAPTTVEFPLADQIAPVAGAAPAA